MEGNNFFQPTKQADSGYILFTVRFSTSSKMDFYSADNEIMQSCSYSIYFSYALNSLRRGIEYILKVVKLVLVLAAADNLPAHAYCIVDA